MLGGNFLDQSGEFGISGIGSRKGELGDGPPRLAGGVRAQGGEGIAVVPRAGLEINAATSLVDETEVIVSAGEERTIGDEF